MPNLGPDFDLATRLSRLERIVGGLTSQLAQAFSATQSDGSVGMSILQRQDQDGGTVSTWYHGPNTPRDAQTGLHQALLYIGQLFVDGRAATSGILGYREDGTVCFSMTSGGIGFSIYDAKANTIFAPDEVAGQGIALPWIPLPTPVPLAIDHWASTTATDWTSIAQSAIVLQQPKIRWRAGVYCPAGTTADVQLMLGSGVALGAVRSCPENGFTTIDETVTVPPEHGFLESNYLVVNARVTSGAGPVSVQVYGVQGRQS